MYGGVGTGRKSGMSNDRFIIGVAMMGVALNGPGFQQIAQSPFAEVIVVAGR